MTTDIDRTPGYDVIGDIHGSARKLVALLERLGYTRRSTVWRHPERTAVFVGDLIDRGDQQLDVLRIVRGMQEAEAAHVILGNHEFNAIAWATEHPDQPGTHLRDHTTKRHQHAEFLRQIGEGSRLHHDAIDWFRTLPMWLDLDGLRVVHACWHEPSQHTIGRHLTDEVLVASHRHGSPEHTAIEWTLKGPEVDLPDGYTYLDKDDHPRAEARFRWWDPDATTFRRAAVVPPGSRTVDGHPLPELPDEPHGHDHLPGYDDPVPLVVGHYWETGTPTPWADHVACVDYSAVKGGPLVAYRFNLGDTRIRGDRYVAAA